VILRSEANLVASLTADWNPVNLERARKILVRIAAEEKARTTREVTCFLPGLAAELLSEAQVLFSASISQKTTEDRWTFNCPQENAAPLADWLIGAGAETVTVAALEYVFCAENTLYRALLSRLSKKSMA
jgi:ATP phosphoribosyltransferase